MALLKFKRSAVPAKIPSIADLALGELAINTYDGKVYTKKDDGTQSIVEVGGNSSGITTITSTDGSVTVTGSGATRDLSVAVAGSTSNVVALVRNNTGATLAKGTVVYINGSLGQNSTVAKAIANSDATSAQTLGLMTANLANNATGYVTVIGVLTGMDTSAFTDGQQLYLSPTTAGTFTATKPYAPQHLVYVAVVEHAHPSQGKLFVKVQNGYEMDELHDVSAQSPSNNHGLFYNTTTGLWENKSIATALGYTPANKAGDAFTGNITTTGLLGVGTASPVSKLHVSVNAGALPPTTSAEQLFTVSGADGASARVLIDSFGGNAGIHMRRANGTAVAPTASLANGYLGFISAWGYGTTAYGGGSQVRIGLMASENWTDTARGTHIVFDTTLNGSTALTERMRIDNNGSVTANVDVRAPIFYDSANTGFYTDPASTSNLNFLTVGGGSVYRADYTTRFQSPSDFVDGTLVTTDIPATASEGNSFVIEITGKTYDQNNPPVKVVAQGYLYNNQIINYSGISYAGNFASYVKVFQDGGVLKFWWPRISYWNSFNVNVMSMDGQTNDTITRNRVTAIGNATEPTGTKKVQITLTKTLKTGDAAGSISGFNNPVTAPTANTIVYRDSAGDISAREIVLSSGLSAQTPTVLVSMYPATNQMVRTTPAAVSAAIQGAASGSWAISVTGNAATATKATNLNQARYTNTDFNTLGSTGQFFRAYTNYIPSGGSYNQPPNGSGDYKVIQWGDVEGGDGATAGNWGGQIVQNFYTDRMWFRRSYATTWQAWREFIHDGNYTSFAMPIGSSATNSVDVRAPIFYDSNNTNYYVDPASTSVLNSIAGYSLRNIEDVSVNTPYGIYFSSNFNGDYAIYRESGAWSHPYPDLRIAFHTGIKMGALAGYGGMRFYTNSDMATQVMSINNGADGLGGGHVFVNDVLQAGGSLRAPIFYDSNNTAYYLNPNDTQSLRTVGDWRSDSSGWTGEFNGKIQYHASNWYFQAANEWIFRKSDSNSAFWVTQSGVVQCVGDMRAPIFYDYNNTGYYVDPTSSGIALRTVGYWIADTSGWAGDIDGKIQRHNNSWYFSASNAWIFRATSGAEPFTVSQAGVAIATGDFRAPLYYDNADTSYYLDLNGGGSQLRGRVNVVGPHGGTSIRLALPAAENGATSGIAALQMWCSEPGNSWTGAGFGYNVSNDLNEAGNVPAYYFGRINTGLGQAYMRMEENGHWHFYNTPQGSNTRYTTMSLYNTGYALAHQSFRAPIFYDSDNTGYYLNAADGGTSLNVAGSIVAAGNVTAYSDIRIKANVETIPDALDKLDHIRGVTYTRIDLDDKEQRYAGVIAQEIEAVLPEAVRDLGNIKAVDYNATIALLIQAVKELRDKVEALRK